MARSTSAFVRCLSRPLGPTISSVVLPASNSSNAVSSFVLYSMRSPNIADNAAYTKFRRPSERGRNLDPIDLLDMLLDFASRHAPGVERNDSSVKLPIEV